MSSYIGRICKFWNENKKAYYIGALTSITNGKYTVEDSGSGWENFQPLTIRELREYKVTLEKLTQKYPSYTRFVNLLKRVNESIKEYDINSWS